MKHLLIILSLFILFSFLTSCEKKEQINITLPDGVKYIGEGKDDLMNGQGTLTYPSGDKYIGEFKDGEYHGQGTFTFNDGAKYVEEFKDGIIWNGEVYNGNIKHKIVNGK